MTLFRFKGITGALMRARGNPYESERGREGKEAECGYGLGDEMAYHWILSSRMAKVMRVPLGRVICAV